MTVAGWTCPRWVAIWFSLDRRVTHRTIRRKVVGSGGRHWHVANVATPDDLDDALRDLLSEAYRSTLS